MKPLSVGELLDAAFAAVRRNFGQLVLATLVVIVPVSVVNTLILSSTNDHAFDFATRTKVSGDDVGPYIAGLLASYLLTLIAQTLTAAALLRSVGGDVVGAPAGAGESLRYAAHRIGPLLWVTLLFIGAVLVGVLMCFVGAIWLGILFALSTPALLFEEKRGVAAMRRSRQLLENNWWRVFGTLVVGYLLVAILQGILGGVVGGVILANSNSQTLNAVILTLVNIVGFAISLPFASALITYVYFDLRVRKEGFDLQLAAREIGGDRSASDSGPGSSTTIEGLGLPASDAPPSTGFLPPRPPEPPGG